MIQVTMKKSKEKSKLSTSKVEKSALHKIATKVAQKSPEKAKRERSEEPQIEDTIAEDKKKQM